MHLVKEIISDIRPKQLEDMCDYEDEVFTSEEKDRKVRYQQKLLKKQWRDMESKESLESE